MLLKTENESSLEMSKTGIERFDMKHEMPEDLQELWMFPEIQDAYDKGFEQGLEEAKEVFQEIFIDFIEARYPLLIDVARRQAHLIKDSDTLVRIVCNILDMHKEVEEYLLALGDDAPEAENISSQSQ